MQIAGNDFCAVSTLEAAPGAAEVGATQSHRADGQAVISSAPELSPSSKHKKLSTIHLNAAQIPSLDWFLSSETARWYMRCTADNLRRVSINKAKVFKSFIFHTGYPATGHYTLLSNSTLALPMNIPHKQGHLYHQGQKVGQFPQEDVVILIFFIAWYSYYYFILFKRIILKHNYFMCRILFTLIITVLMNLLLLLPPFSISG